MPTVNLEPHHRFHSYFARFPSEIVEAALEQYTKPGESVLDLFWGSGTTLVACRAHGRAAVGTDIDVLAGMLSEVKCQPRSGSEYDAWRRRFAARITTRFDEIERAWEGGRPGRPSAARGIVVDWVAATACSVLPRTHILVPPAVDCGFGGHRPGGPSL